jgi:hypothetical protein
MQKRWVSLLEAHFAYPYFNKIQVKDFKSFIISLNDFPVDGSTINPLLKKMRLESDLFDLSENKVPFYSIDDRIFHSILLNFIFL